MWIDRSPGCALAPRSCAMAPLEMPLKEAAIELARMGFEPWLKAHGKLRRPDMSRKQALELRECFELIDAGGAGVVSTREVPLAFTVLGMDLTRTEIDDAIREINANKRSMEFPAFMRLMLSKLDKLQVDEYSPSESGKDPSSEYTLPFALLAQAYRRKKLIEAVMGGDKKLQDRMNFRSRRSFVERKALRDVASGKAKEEPKGNVSMTLEPTEREKKRAKAAALKEHPRPQSHEPEPALPSYLIANVGSDVRELLVGEKLSETIKAVLDSDVKFVPPMNKSIESDRPLSGFGDEKVIPAYLREKLETFRTDMRHKPTMKRQVIRVQALKSLRDFYKKGSMQVKGSPILYPAARRPTVAPTL